ncbi:CGP-CTERM sorting domain-containing protein [Thermococcus gorgonarius]|uniref:Aminotransferase n=1 Tax=Thermococcus gorgonarius TaxID=71997 RepID=A0A2Z2MGJ6_THEGO|nr:CGP-CTERM sorting domain-containing protein [Thermococcus gorgonarius]ASJ01088.1 aminotransferase [Thermococcus gorgonarius]
MRKAAIMIAVFVFFGVFGFAMASAATVGVDLAHGENDKGLTALTDQNGNVLVEGMIKKIGDVTWVYIGPADKADTLGIQQVGEKITYDAIKNIDFLIIGQPTQPFSPDEINALKQWWNDGNRILWIAGDSDYGSGVQTIDNVNAVLEQLGVNLRLDQCSVEDSQSNAGAGYRVVGIVNPDDKTPNKDDITKDFQNGGKVLFHGPGVVAYVDDSGNWKALESNAGIENVYVIVTTSENGQIVENNDPPAKAYTAGATGKFPLLAVQTFPDKKNLLIVSSETPYGGYEPMWAPEYHGVKLDGPTFVTNFIHWAMDTQANLGKSESGGGGICGPAALVGLAIIPLLLRRRK